MDESKIVDLLFDILREDLSTTINYSALNCISLSLMYCAEIDQY